MLILNIFTAWALIGVVMALLTGETFQRMRSVMPQPHLAAIARPTRANAMRHAVNARRAVR
jgi:hypothetical protein